LEIFYLEFLHLHDQVIGVADAHLLGDLPHDRSLPDAGAAHQEHRPLPLPGDQVSSLFVLRKIRPDDADQFFLCFTDIHESSC